MSVRRWYTTTGGVVVDWAQAVVGGRAVFDVVEVVDTGRPGGVSSVLWAPAGAVVSTSRVDAARASASSDPVPSRRRVPAVLGGAVSAPSVASSASVPAVRSVPATDVFEGTPLLAYGDSLGINNAVPMSPGANYPSRLARRLGMSSVVNRHVGGDRVQDMARKAVGTAATYPVGTTTGLVTVVCGGNNVKDGRATAGDVNSYANGLSAFFALTRADRVVQAATGTKTGTWATTADVGGFSGTTQTTTENGATLTLTSPAGFSTCTLVLLATPTGSPSATVSVDGGAPVNVAMGDQAVGTNSGSSVGFPRVVHFKGLSTSAAHTFKITHAGAASATLRVAGLLPWAATSPLVAVLDLVRAGPLLAFDDSPYRAAFAQVLADFPSDGSIVVVKATELPAAAADQAPFFAADGVHLNDRGQAVLADAFVSALAPVSWRAGVHRSILA